MPIVLLQVVDVDCTPQHILSRSCDEKNGEVQTRDMLFVIVDGNEILKCRGSRIGMFVTEHREKGGLHGCRECLQFPLGGRKGWWLRWVCVTVPC